MCVIGVCLRERVVYECVFEEVRESLKIRVCVCIRYEDIHGLRVCVQDACVRGYVCVYEKGVSCVREVCVRKRFTGLCV